MCDPAPRAPPAPCKTELSGSSAGDQNESTVITETADDLCNSTKNCIAREMSETLLLDNENDPSRYVGKRLNSQTITHLIKLGPSQPNGEIMENHASSG